MENKNEFDLKEFMSNFWNRLIVLICTKSFDKKPHLAKKEVLNQDFNHNSDNETEKYNIEDIEAVKTNKFICTEKTKIIIYGR